MIQHPQPHKKIDYISDVEAKVGRHRLTLRRWWEKNNFPKPTLISGRLAWDTDVINKWIKQNVQGVQQNEQGN